MSEKKKPFHFWKMHIGTILIIATPIVIMLGASTEFANFFFETTETVVTEKNNIIEVVTRTVFKSKYEIAVPIITGIIAIIGIALLNRRTKANESQAITAHTASERNELEKIEKDYREAVKELASKDHNVILMACTTIKQITIKRPEEFLETTYKILLETLHSSFFKTVLVKKKISEIAKKVDVQVGFTKRNKEIELEIKKLEADKTIIEEMQKDGHEHFAYEEHKLMISYDVAVQHAIRTSGIDFTDISKFQICFETIGQIRVSNDVIKAEKKLGLTKLLFIHDIDFESFDEHSLGIIGDFVVENASFEDFRFLNCNFSSVHFKNTNFCYEEFFADEDFKEAHEHVTIYDPSTFFTECILQVDSADEIAVTRYDDWLFRTRTVFINCDVFVSENFQYKDIKNKSGNAFTVFTNAYFDAWQKSREKPNSRVHNKEWAYIIADE